MEELENEDGCVETKYVRVHRRLGLILRNIHERDWGCKRVEVDEERSNHDERWGVGNWRDVISLSSTGMEQSGLADWWSWKT